MEHSLQKVVNEFSRKKAEHEDSETASDQEEKKNRPDQSTKLRVKTHHPSDPDGDKDPSSSDDEASERRSTSARRKQTRRKAEKENKSAVEPGSQVFKHGYKLQNPEEEFLDLVGQIRNDNLETLWAIQQDCLWLFRARPQTKNLRTGRLLRNG